MICVSLVRTSGLVCSLSFFLLHCNTGGGQKWHLVLYPVSKGGGESQKQSRAPLADKQPPPVCPGVGERVGAVLPFCNGNWLLTMLGLETFLF